MVNKTERIVIRCSLKTKEEWRRLLYEMKKRHLDAESLFKMMIDCFTERYMAGRIL